MSEKEQCLKVLRDFEVEVSWTEGKENKTGKAILTDGGEGEDKYYYYEPIVEQLMVITQKTKRNVEEQLDWVTTMCTHNSNNVQAIKSADYDEIVSSLLK